MSFRRTLVGLKPSTLETLDDGPQCFRRTLVGLKRAKVGVADESEPVSDEPSWG